ncbi:translationally controlled tumor protein-domain-containing protein [Baffinella frigidus]|nr:translationally controlled tumor protein-domain-containing protein [Cryptophyta sp. CCMP2293]
MGPALRSQHVCALLVLELAIAAAAATVGTEWGRSAGLSRSIPTHQDRFAFAPMMRLRGGLLIYKDIVSGDEMVSDSFPTEVIDGVMLKVKSSIITKGAISINTGANAAEEGTEEDEGVDDPTAERVNDVVEAFGLQSMGRFDKPAALAWAKGYLKLIKEKLDANNPERSALFQEKAQGWVKNVLLKNVADFEFYCGNSFNSEGALAMAIFEGANHAPSIFYFKDGLDEEKA